MIVFQDIGKDTLKTFTKPFMSLSFNPTSHDLKLRLNWSVKKFMGLFGSFSIIRWE